MHCMYVFSLVAAARASATRAEPNLSAAEIYELTVRAKKRNQTDLISCSAPVKPKDNNGTPLLWCPHIGPPTRNYP